jgi:hypothetical protein
MHLAFALNLFGKLTHKRALVGFVYAITTTTTKSRILANIREVARLTAIVTTA